MVRLSTSRPKRSVPNGCAADGALSASATFISVGSYGVTTPANAASRTMATTMDAPNTTSRLRSAAPSHARRGCGAATRSLVSAIVDPRIEVGVEQVDDQVGDQEQRADEQDRALDQRVV